MLDKLIGLRNSLKSFGQKIALELEPVTKPLTGWFVEIGASLRHASNALKADLRLIQSLGSTIKNVVKTGWNALVGLINNSQAVKAAVYDNDVKQSSESFENAGQRFTLAQQHFVALTNDAVAVKVSLGEACTETMQALSHAQKAATYGLTAVLNTPSIVGKLATTAANQAQLLFDYTAHKAKSDPSSPIQAVELCDLSVRLSSIAPAA